jgi:endonuclease YncB( thermonuclease family)
MASLKKYIIVICLSFLSSFSIFQVHALSNTQEIITGKVIGVSDGDTITLLNEQREQIKVRLTGIDCPEKSQAFGNRAKKELSDKVFSQNVKVEVRGKDKYGRSLGIVKIGDEDVNEFLISQGVAWHYKKYAKTQPAEEASRYARAEELARQNKKGLWIQDRPIPPWEFRDQAKKSNNK